MARILVIDNESKCVGEIQKALTELNSQNTTESFSSFTDFEKHVAQTETEAFDFSLIILEYSLLKPHEWAEKIQFIRTKNKDVPICFTTYDNATVNRKYLFSLSILNILYKPFDPLIIKELLNVASKTGEKISLVEIKPQSAAAFVGILKELEIISINELGFTSYNETAIPVNSFSKYYSPIFSIGNKQSVWAKCIASEPAKDKEGFFVNQFTYTGIDNSSLSTVRKYIQAKKSSKINDSLWSLDKSSNTHSAKIAILGADPIEITNLKTNVEERFSNVSIEEILYDANKKDFEKNVHYDLVINITPALKFESYKDRFTEQTKHILFFDQTMDDEKFKLLLPNYHDIFFNPLDRGYFYKKLKLLAPSMEFKESADIISVQPSEKIKAVNFVKTSQVSEIYLAFSYHRELPKGEFREFAFVTENENQIIELPAFCNFAEKGQGDSGGKSGTVYNHQFVFWGTTDFYLKQIRIWLLHTYVQQNQGEG